MWLMTKHGFYSTVADRDRPDGVVVRARTREDLENLCELGTFEPQRISGPDPSADYRWRIFMTRNEWELLATRMAADIDYDNFKNAVWQQDRDRAHLYSDVWTVMHRAQENEVLPGAGENDHLDA